MDEQIFRIHRYFLIRESKVFREILQRPSLVKAAEQPDDTPIVLSGITCREFESLLDFLYEG